MADEVESNVRRLVLKGERFTGGRLPVDSLIELERYQQVVRTLAKFEWEAEHEGEQAPPDFDEVGLTIVRLEDGSADLTLTLDRPPSYASYVDESADAFGETLRAAYDGGELPELPPAVREDFRALVAQFGDTLTEGDSISVHEPKAEAPIVVTPERRDEAIARLRLEDFWYTANPEDARNVLRVETAALVGRFTELDADHRRYTFQSLLHGRLLGHYSDPGLTADIRLLLESSAVAPITRVTGELQYQNGKAWRFRETDSVERFGIEDDGWGARLIEFAQLTNGWGDNSDGVPITIVALGAARELMSAVDEAGVGSPALFPLSDGGVLMEWASTRAVRSIEVTADGSFELFELTSPSGESKFVVTGNLRVAQAFAVQTVAGGVE